MYLIYLDACCLNRPFDDQTQERIHLEAEAVLLILTRSQNREWHLLGSDTVQFEISQIPDEERKQKVLLLASLATSHVNVTGRVQLRAVELEALGFKAYDALHIACAEAGKADLLLTTDDRVLRTAKKHSNVLKVQVENPVEWMMEVTEHEAKGN